MGLGLRIGLDPRYSCTGRIPAVTGTWQISTVPVLGFAGKDIQFEKQIKKMDERGEPFRTGV